jgi:hypothetical protein
LQFEDLLHFNLRFSLIFLDIECEANPMCAEFRERQLLGTVVRYLWRCSVTENEAKTSSGWMHPSFPFVLTAETLAQQVPRDL